MAHPRTVSESRSRSASKLEQNLDNIGAPLTYGTELYNPRTTHGAVLHEHEDFGELSRRDMAMAETGETSEEYDIRWRSIYITYLTVFLSSTGFSLVLPSIWPYIQSVNSDAGPEILGWTIATFGLAQCIGALFFGWWADRFKVIKIAMIVSVLLTIIGNVIYAYAAVPSNVTTGVVMIIIGRFSVGLGAGDVALGRTYVSAATTMTERTKAVATLSAAIAVGYIAGPLLQTVFTKIGEEGVTWEAIQFTLNMYTTPVYTSAFLGILNIILLALRFKDCPLSFNESDDAEPGENKEANETVVEEENLLDWVAVGATCFQFCVTTLIFAAYDTIGTTFIMDMYGYEPDTAVLYQGLLLSAVAAVFVVVVFCLKFLKRILSERALFLAGFVITLAGVFIMMPWGTNTMLDEQAKRAAEEEVSLFNAPIDSGGNITYKICYQDYGWCETTAFISFPQYLIGFILNMGIGYGISVIMASTIYSKVLGNLNQGKMMGWLTAAASVARIIGPIFISQVYESQGPRMAFGIMCLIVIVSIFMIAILYERFVPYGMREIYKIHFEDLNSESDFGDKSKENAGFVADDELGTKF
ncbi:major facilitator superfamily domain-containing protein 8-like [Antedon mediterranea]|uniref:major facilitator superfamily domain-containing protein 8-like n=1 Tax=Antedon mediterranea TaxID=105859 RepID=UPI003AF4217C